ncbi:MAG TPA: tRNA uridine-5-carboxymethylaminomethyl(34) synthesis GTPase MnmE [Candidatus Cloacimonetes bacterium]|nr:tRNA uridine-5-carboxymethylaminomethyl(34) synthesis GTPase MnmE [Candidatus Cloacimonadota bacterium]
MGNHKDTIAAIATPVGQGGISVIRISGTDAMSIISKIFRKNDSNHILKSHHIYYGKIVNERKIIDDVLVSVFLKPKSYTGEDVVEISCHGGMFVTQKVLQQVLNNGARHAKRGEFTQRAFMNGKMDLTEAEAVVDLINAKTAHTLESAINQLEGRLYISIKKILQKLIEIRSNVELDIDFSDQELGEETDDERRKALVEIKTQIESLISTGNQGIILNEGYRVAIAGPANAGKSSVFNRIIENERSIVTDIAGTTRDYIEEDIALEGYLVKIYDTAGLRESKDTIEKYGMNKTLEIISNAHLILWIEDSTVSRETFPELMRKMNIIRVKNKVDLLNNPSMITDGIPVSAKTGEGIQELKNLIVNNISIEEYDLSKGLISNSRQLAAVEKSNVAIKNAIQALDDSRGLEFLAFDLREASEHLEEVIGKVTSEEIINSIFDRFCVGK